MAKARAASSSTRILPYLVMMVVFVSGIALGAVAMYVALPRVSISPEAVILRLKPGAEYSQSQLQWWLDKLERKDIQIEGGK